MIYLVSIGAVLLAGLIALLWATRVAPRGHEDEFGFHSDQKPVPARSPTESRAARRQRRSHGRRAH